MKRELKFRVWDSAHKLFYYQNEFSMYINGDSHYNQWGIPRSDCAGLDTLIWQQTSGLLDKDGKDIYEGDIIEIDGGALEKPIGEVIFQDGCFCFKASWIDKKPDLYKSYPELKNYTVFHELEDDREFKDAVLVKVVGNIFENPKN